jgi:hypothetical protein
MFIVNELGNELGKGYIKALLPICPFRRARRTTRADQVLCDPFLSLSYYAG